MAGELLQKIQKLKKIIKLLEEYCEKQNSGKK